MDSIVTTALAGTARQERVSVATGTPVDALISALPEGEVERAFLLSAGAWAVYRQAGRHARQLDEVLAPANEEKLRECSSGAALLLSRLLGGEKAELLPEALERLRQKGFRLPYSLLPQALNATGKETRAALFPLLGERGLWLSQFNSGWKWVQNYLSVDESGLPAEAETIWQEGTPGQRVEILRRLRAVNPDQARSWLEAVWKQEKAEVRNEMVHALEIGLGIADEPFLERNLDDRAGSVRATSALLLSRLADSAFSERMRQRGQKMLRMVDGQIELKLPNTFESSWLRDGIVEKPPDKTSKRGWWLIQVLSLISPTFWETHLDAQPAELLALIPADNVWRMQVIEGWSRAAINYRVLDWMTLLWTWWFEYYQESSEKRSGAGYAYIEQLLQQMPGPVAEKLILDLFRKKKEDQLTEWGVLLSGLPRPWGKELARNYLRLLRAHCTLEKLQASSFNPYSDPWFNDLATLALALPASCFAEALQPWDIPEDSKWQIQYVHQRLREFTETIHMRQKIEEEIV